MLKLSKSQFLLALFFFLSVISCKSTFNTWGDNTLEDKYSFITYNPDHNIKFHSLGGRRNENRFIYKKYGKLVFTNKDYLGRNRIFSSLFIVDKIPKNLLISKPVTISLYNTEVHCYEYQHNKVYERYFQYKNINYAFVVEFKKIRRGSKYNFENYISQEMEGLEL